MNSRIVVDEGDMIKTYKRLPNGDIVYDLDGKLPWEGGFPFIILDRDVPATEKDREELLKIVLPLSGKERK